MSATSLPDTAAIEPTKYDVIGDVHGHAERLTSMLKVLGYLDRDRKWTDPGRRVVFVGDLIDRGPGQLETLRLVRSMVEKGLAQVLLGNHEFNAIAYATVDPVRLDYCRPHSAKNTRQHEVFLSDVPFGSPLHRSILDWFMTFPLWLDLGGLRVVHACWSDPHIEHLASRLDGGPLTEQIVIDGTTKGTDTYKAIEIVLKGPEIEMRGVHYDDKDGNPRKEARRRWWDGSATTLRDAALIPPGTQLVAADGSPVGQLDDHPLQAEDVAPYTADVPVIFGHYWWRKGSAETFNPMATCVDYSVAKNGVLRAYQWDGESQLLESKFVDC